MAYGLLFKRPFGDKENPFVYVETDETGNIVEEPWDNGLSRRVTFTGISIAYKPQNCSEYRQSYLANDKKYDLYITDSRLIFRLQSLKQELKFKGSLIDYGVDALLKKHKDKKVEGLAILGHLRYEWLANIMYFEKTGRKSDNMLRFSYFDGENTLWQVTITFPHDMDVRFLANETLHMACRYCEKTTNEKSKELREFIEKYKTEDIPAPEEPQNRFTAIGFPTVKKAAYGVHERPVI